ncbi:MAG: hypothetical protein CV088_20280 [Nitrospira sp. LK70]|nr:hypothetical protein [Nitrospira sp. LK70]
MSMSVRGVARHFLSQTGPLSVYATFLSGVGGNPTLRARIESIARQEITFDVSECTYSWTARYEQIWSHVRVRVQLDPDTGISAATMATLRTTWENAIENRWSNRWSIGRPGEVACPITFDVQWITNNAHHLVRVQAGPARSNMTLWDTSDTGAVAAHEFGHMHGNPDEYTDANCSMRTPVNTGTVMDNNSNNIPQRLMQRLATNVGSNVL